eukprot:symbB.v1.2.017361.t1/scaffold1352.1/size234417/10
MRSTRQRKKLTRLQAMMIKRKIRKTKKKRKIKRKRAETALAQMISSVSVVNWTCQRWIFRSLGSPFLGSLARTSLSSIASPRPKQSPHQVLQHPGRPDLQAPSKHRRRNWRWSNKKSCRNWSENIRRSCDSSRLILKPGEKRRHNN